MAWSVGRRIIFPANFLDGGVSVSSAFAPNAGAGTTLALTYPPGNVGDTLYIWLTVQDSTAPTVGGHLTSGEQVSSSSSGSFRLRFYKRTRLSGDTGATFAVPSTFMAAICANVPGYSTNPTTSSVFGVGPTTFTPSSDGGPGLFLTWWSFADLILTPSAPIFAHVNASTLADQDNYQVGLHLRLYQVTGASTVKTATPDPLPTGFIRFVSYTGVP